MDKEELLTKVFEALRCQLPNVLLFTVKSQDDYPDALSLVVVSDFFIYRHQVDIDNFILNTMKSALGADLYRGLYSFTGLSTKEFKSKFKHYEVTLHYST